MGTRDSGMVWGHWRGQGPLVRSVGHVVLVLWEGSICNSRWNAAALPWDVASCSMECGATVCERARVAAGSRCRDGDKACAAHGPGD